MSITTDRTGNRSAGISVDVSGSVEEVWEAVASGTGLSGWFLPCEFQFGFDGEPVRVLAHMGPHTEKAADIKDWDAPHRYRLSLENVLNGVPAMSVVVTVVPIDSGCRVRIEQSFDSPSPEWDTYLLAAQKHWKSFLGILRLYLSHFSGKRCQTCSVLSATRDDAARAWEKLAEPLGLSWVSVGERCKSEADAPVLAGILEALDDEADTYQALIRLDEPSPGIAHLQIAHLYGQNVPTLRLYFYGEHAAKMVAREEPRWQVWLSDLFMH